MAATAHKTLLTPRKVKQTNDKLVFAAYGLMVLAIAWPNTTPAEAAARRMRKASGNALYSVPPM